MKRQKIIPVIIFLMLALVMMQFQNCAPAQEGILELNEDVGLIDSPNSSKLRFKVDSYLVKNDVDIVNIEGECDIPEVEYQIIKVNADSSESMITQGYAPCVAGSFQLEMTSANDYLQSCDDVVEIEAGAENAAFSDSTMIRLQCFN